MDTKCIAIVLGLFAAACGTGQDEEATAPPTPYAQMSFSQRAVFMNDVVLPQMRETFVAFDPKYASMGCKTCHGDGAIDATFAMPSPQIPPLPGSEEGFYEYMKDPEKARFSQFMIGEVWPKMADLLQLPKFDPATHRDGFSCSNCHTLIGPGH